MTENKQQPTPKIKPLVSSFDDYSNIPCNNLVYSLGEKTTDIERVPNTSTYRGNKGGDLTLYCNNIMKENRNELLRRGDEVILSFSEVNFKVFIFLMRQFYLKAEQVTSIQIDDYRELCGFSDNKTAKEQIKATLDLLMTFQFSFYVHDKYSDEMNLRDQFIYSYADNKRSFLIRYSDCFYTYLQERSKNSLDLPNAFFRIDLKRYPNALTIFFTFCDIRRKNGGKPITTLSVNTILSRCNYPTYEELKDSGAIKRKIIDRLVKDLEYLSGVFSFRFCHKGGKPLTKDEEEKYQGYTFPYSFFITLNIEVTWKEKTPYNIAEARAIQEAKLGKNREKQLNKKAKTLKKKEKELEEREQALQSYT